MTKSKKSLLALILAASMAASLASCGGGSATTSTPAESSAPSESAETSSEEASSEESSTSEAEATTAGSTPRNETVYFGGQQWGTLNDFNPMSAGSNNWCQSQGDSSRVFVYESLFIYNMLDGKLYPLLGTDYAWNDEQTALTVHLNPDAHWNDGTPVTAEDVAYTWEVHVKYASSRGLDMSQYIDSIEATDEHTVTINAKLDDSGVSINPLKVVDYIAQTYVMQKAYLEKVEERCNYDAEAVKLDTMEDLVVSGPYYPYYYDDQKVVYQRDDNYWGQADSMWGKLPVPKYLAHTIYSDNNAAQVAFANGEIDCNQQFITDVQKMWEEQDLPITTYLDEQPYGICVQLPTAWFNVEREGLDQVAVRKAIAMAVDYDQIISSAMSNQSPSFKDVPRSIMNPTDGEQKMYDHDAVKDLQWVGKDIAGANTLLDEAGIVDSDGDGIREYNGKNLSFQAECPSGWTDWNAALEIVAAAGKEIGIDISTYFPDANTYYADLTTCNFDIGMWSPAGASVNGIYSRAMGLFSSSYIQLESNWSGNFGHYVNERADEILSLLPHETDEATLKNYYTELTEIYLTDVPSFTLMFRPQYFYACNETVWTGFPVQGDGIPPTVLTDGYGIAGLYQLELVNP